MKNILFALAILLFTLHLTAQAGTNTVYDSLPTPVREHLIKKYSRYRVSDIKKAVDNTGTVNYLVEARMQLKPGTISVVSLVYLPWGTLVSSKKEKEISYTGNEPVHTAPHSAGDGHQH